MNKLAIVFTGQGSQKVGMGRDFVEKYVESDEIFERASSAINVDLKKLCFEESPQLNLTEFAQPAILTMEVALLQALRKHAGITPTLFAGHSLGEYTALVAAGVFKFEDALQIVKKRGSLMQNAVPEGLGAMAAIIGENVGSGDVGQIVSESGAEIANFNSTQQIVISGKKEAVEAANAKIKQVYPALTVISLNVSAPFHCSLMAVIQNEFLEFLESFEDGMDLERVRVVVSNFTGELHAPQSLLANLVKQISGSVQWLRNMELIRSLSSEVLEIGPARVLAKFFATLDVAAHAVTDLRSLQKFETIQKAA